MKILIISHEFPPIGGGAGIVAKQYCDYLLALNHSVTIISANIDSKTEQGITKIKPKNYSFFWPISYYNKLCKLSLDKYDTIILNDVGATLVAGLFLKKAQLEKSIVVLHGQEPEQIYTQATSIYKILKFKKYYHRVIINSKKIIAVSNYMKNKFIEFALSNNEKKIIADKITVSYTGISNKNFTLTNKNKTTNENNKLNLLTVSRIEKEKGFDECIELAIKLKAASINFEWLIIGNGSYLEKLKEEIVQNELTDYFKLLGRIPQEELSCYYKNADLFLLFSHMTESFGLVYLEAQLCGCPAIGFNRYGVKESIFDKKTGFLVNNINEAFFIIKNEDYKSIKISSAYFNEFSFAQASNRLNRIINE